jgi:uncharacterized protein YcbX
MEVDASTPLTLLVAAASVLAAFGLLYVVSYKKGASVQDINIYPIKSCAEIRVTAAKATPLGFENDRIAQFTDGKGSVCTPRAEGNSKLFHIRPSYAASQGNTIITLAFPGQDPISLDTSKSSTKEVVVEAMDTSKVTLQDHGDEVSQWLEKATGIKECRLTGIGSNYKRNVHVNADQGDAIPDYFPDPPVSLADEAPYLLTSTSSLKDLNSRMTARGKEPVPMNRFRPNIVLNGLRPWEEDTWKKIRIGGFAEFWVWQRCGRCTMTTIDRKSLKRSGEPLATLSTFRERANGQRNFGMHLIPVDQSNSSNHIIKVGDKLEVLEYDDERRKEWKTLFLS